MKCDCCKRDVETVDQYPLSNGIIWQFCNRPECQKRADEILTEDRKMEEEAKWREFRELNKLIGEQ